MRIVVLAVGRLRAPYVDDVQHYERLLARQGRVEVQEVRDAARVPGRLPGRAFVALLDPAGSELDSVGFADFLEQRRLEGRDLWFVLGGAHGIDVGAHPIDRRLSFGKMTLPHQLARVVLLEQLYRAHKIIAGEPYHH